jgi:hypothetical protein
MEAKRNEVKFTRLREGETDEIGVHLWAYKGKATLKEDACRSFEKVDLKRNLATSGIRFTFPPST